jgi:hypothetical protein
MRTHKRLPISFVYLLGFIFGIFVLNGCASRPPAASAINEVRVEPQPVSSAEGGDLIKPSASDSVQDAGKIFSGQQIDRKDLDAFDLIQIDLTHAELFLSTQKGIKKGSLLIRRVDGNCDYKLIEREFDLYLTDSVFLSAVKSKKSKSFIPALEKCHFEVQLVLPEAARLKIHLKRGLLSLDHWRESLELKMGWGDIDLFESGSKLVDSFLQDRWISAPTNIDIECGRCTLTGMQLEGSLKYNLEAGNVGLSLLEDSVEGKTLGDTVLRWKKLALHSKIQVESKAGDVHLFFPGGAPIRAELKNLTIKPGEEDPLAKFSVSNLSSSIPVEVSAESGNVKLYRLKGVPEEF